MKPRLLIIEPHSQLASTLQEAFEQHGFNIEVTNDGELGYKKGLNTDYDLIIADIETPGFRRLLGIQQLKEHITTPILILTACQNEFDRMMCFTLGADDFLIKPCRLIELLSRSNALIQRHYKNVPPRNTITFDQLSIDCAKRIVTIEGKNVKLTTTEFNILEILIRTPNQVFSKEELTKYALRRKFTAYDRSIDVHVSHLRRKLKPSLDRDTWVQTIRGYGYMFKSNV